MVIALDWDGTFTADVWFWTKFTKLAKSCDHQVFVVSMRYQDEEIRLPADAEVDRIIYTSRKAKTTFLASLGIFPDIWIDDMPAFLMFDAIGRNESSSA